MLWSKQQHAFVVEAYFSNGRSMIAVQRTFCRHFEIPPRGRVPDRKCFLMWIYAFRTLGNVSKERKDFRRHLKKPLEHLKRNEFVC
ncbi:DUF4817 domain-containing protein [Trichonephila clavipes]|nr:DUF4817 domain-containing protein [Trichonephila clavipes]